MGRASDAKERLMDAVQELIWEGSYGSTDYRRHLREGRREKGELLLLFRVQV